MNKEYLVYLHNYDARSSKMLGSFDDNDKYSIPDNLKAELLKSNKLITDYQNDIIKAVATVNSYTFYFTVFIQKGENNKKRAALFLTEKPTFNFIDKEISTLISSFVFVDVPNYIDIVKNKFNLFIRDESEGIDMDNITLLEIINLLDSNNARNKRLIEEMINSDKMYISSVISILKKSGDLGNQILKEFKKAVLEKKLDKSDPKFWAFSKNILDKLIMENAILLPSETLAQIDKLKAAYVVVAKKSMQAEASKNDDVILVKKPDKAKGGSKPKGGGGKKDDKKKDDKKKGGDKNKGGGGKGDSKGGKPDDKSKDAKKESKKEKITNAKKIVKDTNIKHKPGKPEKDLSFIDSLSGTENVTQETETEKEVYEISKFKTKGFDNINPETIDEFTKGFNNLNNIINSVDEAENLKAFSDEIFDNLNTYSSKAKEVRNDTLNTMSNSEEQKDNQFSFEFDNDGRTM